MKFAELLDIVGDEPTFESGLLMAGKANPNAVRLQLSRWKESGRIWQLRRGLYALAPPYQKKPPHPFLVANRLQRASYVSLQSALAFYGMIPDTVQITVSVTAGRPERLETPVGIFEYRHVKTSLLAGYTRLDFDGQQALVAVPEKALLDLVYFHAGGELRAYVSELRLQNLEQIDWAVLEKKAELFHSAKIRRAAEWFAQLVQAEARDYEAL